MARKLDIEPEGYGEFRETLRLMVSRGQIELGKGRVVRLPGARGELVGTFSAIRKGGGFVRMRSSTGERSDDIYIAAEDSMDAASGDRVLVRVSGRMRGSSRGPRGRIVEIIERASQEFVGTYVVKDQEAFVLVDGTIFHEAIYVGDPGVKGAETGDKVVFEMVRFPSAEFHGEGVITEVLGPRGDPDVDLRSILRQFKIPEEFSPQALEEARREARRFESAPHDPSRRDLSGTTIITIDPADARDFDDAVNLDRDENGHWRLGVHIADVAAFVRPGTSLDGEARARATSVYLPGKVIPMLPEILSNGLASLQEGRPRYTKSVFVEFDPAGHITAVDFENTVIKVDRRFTYDEVQQLFDDPKKAGKHIPRHLADKLQSMRELAAILRNRRRERGFIELAMPEAKVVLDRDGRVTGAQYVLQDEAHRLIEEFMLTANEAVAQKLEDEKLSFLRRIHPHPDPLKLHGFGEFVRSVGIEVEDDLSRFELQRIAREVADHPEARAVHYAMLRSMPEAYYGPDVEGHFALASPCYCHFTSPIRRYPDLTIHRMLDNIIHGKKAGYDHAELVVLGEHCSFAERRAAKAERELVKLKVLDYMKDHVGEQFDMIITGVEEFGFFAQAKDIPAEGLVHVRTLPDDYYTHDPKTHTLRGRRLGHEYRLGTEIRCLVAKVDREYRQLDLRIVAPPKPTAERPPRRDPKSSRRTRRPPPRSAQKSRGSKGRKSPKRR